MNSRAPAVTGRSRLVVEAAMLALALTLVASCQIEEMFAECQRCLDEGRVRVRCGHGLVAVAYCPQPVVVEPAEPDYCEGYPGYQTEPCASRGLVCRGGGCATPPPGCATPTWDTANCVMTCVDRLTMRVDCSTLNNRPCGPPTCLGCTWEDPCPEGTVCREGFGCLPGGG